MLDGLNRMAVAGGGAHRIAAAGGDGHQEPDRAAATELFRPRQVPGPLGTGLTLADLPPPDTRRWVVRRKAEVLAAINGGLLSAAEACARYRLSPEELDLWQQAVDRAGVPGLRVTRIQLYRDYDCRKPAPPKAAPQAVARTATWAR